LLNYSLYYDLSDPMPRGVAISEAALDALWQRFSGVGFQTDLLVM
jgi:hypothetical protein